MTQELDFRKPSNMRRWLEKRGVSVTPENVCGDGETLHWLYVNYPDIFGDQTGIGPRDDGGCERMEDARVV